MALGHYGTASAIQRLLLMAGPSRVLLGHSSCPSPAVDSPRTQDLRDPVLPRLELGLAALSRHHLHFLLSAAAEGRSLPASGDPEPGNSSLGLPKGTWPGGLSEGTSPPLFLSEGILRLPAKRPEGQAGCRWLPHLCPQSPTGRCPSPSLVNSCSPTLDLSGIWPRAGHPGPGRQVGSVGPAWTGGLHFQGPEAGLEPRRGVSSASFSPAAVHSLPSLLSCPTSCFDFRFR